MADTETLTLDTLPFNDGAPLWLESVEFPPPPKIVEWIRGSDGDGAVLARISQSDNREITARIRVEPRATQDLALAAIGLVADKLQEAERNPVTGVDLVWTPAGATKTITFKVLSGEITGIPVVTSGDDAGWFAFAPVITVRMVCKPFGYGAEVGPFSVTLATLLTTLELTAVAGDVPAEARIRIIDMATQPRRFVRWGLESLDYPLAAPPSLEVDSDSMVVAGYSGAQTTRTGAYDPNATGNNVIRSSLALQVITVCATGDLTHVGSFHVYARVWVTSALVYLRLAWQDGDGPIYENVFTRPPVLNTFAEVDLGTISIDRATFGTQRWAGFIQAYGGTSDTVDVDAMYFVPDGEGFGEARGAYNYRAGVLVARDEFELTAAGNLGGQAAPLGGAWATVGPANDFGGAGGGGSD